MGSTMQAAPLLSCVGMDRHLVARCASPTCERAAPLDPAIWVGQGLGGLPLRAFSERLRCICGSREGRLAVEDGPFPGLSETAEVYVFR